MSEARTRPLVAGRIETGRLVLSPLTAAQAGHIVAGGVDPVGGLVGTAARAGAPIGEGWPHPDTMDGLRLAARGDGVAWLVLRDETVIGDCGTIGLVDPAGVVEIGYGLAEPYRGRGYGGEVVRGLSHWLIVQPGVRRVVAETDVTNVPSRRALRRAGFREAGGRFELTAPDVDRDHAIGI